MDGQISFIFEQRQPIKGYPELHWTGKRPYTSTQYYPAQLKESYGEPKDGWMNKIFWGDNLQVMSHMLKEYRGKIDLVYIDPPFDSKADYKKTIEIKKKKTFSDMSAFEEKQYSDIWTNDEYMQFMYERLILIRDLLCETGSLYLHCDYHRSHYLRCILDEVFGSNNFISKTAYTEITLVAEVAKYFPDIRCTEVARILRESEEGIDKILVAVNEHNDIIYDKIVPTIFEALYRVNKEIVKENVDVKLLKKPKEGGYYEFSGNEDLIIMQNSEDSVVVKNKDKSFHADTYVFDSKPELQLFLQLLANEHVKKAYFTGMFTADQTDFYVPYIDPESNRLRKYYPDFLVKMDDGSYLILEVKGDNMIDDPVVKAKGAAAEEVAVESSMKYEMLKGTDIMEGKAKI